MRQCLYLWIACFIVLVYAQEDSDWATGAGEGKSAQEALVDAQQKAMMKYLQENLDSVHFYNNKEAIVKFLQSDCAKYLNGKPVVIRPWQGKDTLIKVRLKVEQLLQDAKNVGKLVVIRKGEPVEEKPAVVQKNWIVTMGDGKSRNEAIAKAWIGAMYQYLQKNMQAAVLNGAQSTKVCNFLVESWRKYAQNDPNNPAVVVQEYQNGKIVLKVLINEQELLRDVQKLLQTPDVESTTGDSEELDRPEAGEARMEGNFIVATAKGQSRQKAIRLGWMTAMYYSIAMNLGAEFCTTNRTKIIAFIKKDWRDFAKGDAENPTVIRANRQQNKQFSWWLATIKVQIKETELIQRAQKLGAR